jgi:toxin ParE1/3/4
MAHRVVWSRRALQDLQAIAEYIAKDSPAYAVVVVKNIVQQTRLLSQFPRSGRKVPELRWREYPRAVGLQLSNHYRFQENEVLIAAVIHGKRILQ